MNLELFPLDSQTCHIHIASYGWTADDVIYLWRVWFQGIHQISKLYPLYFRKINQSILIKICFFREDLNWPDMQTVRYLENLLNEFYWNWEKSKLQEKCKLTSSTYWGFKYGKIWDKTYSKLYFSVWCKNSHRGVFLSLTGHAVPKTTVLLCCHHLCPHLYDRLRLLDVLLARPQVSPSKGLLDHHHLTCHSKTKKLSAAFLTFLTFSTASPATRGGEEASVTFLFLFLGSRRLK